MKLIGFANKYYTLWEYSSTVITGSDYRKTKVENYKYIKNISMDRETAFSQYPGVEFDENLKGKSWSFDKKTIIGWENNDTYRFGKYQGKKFDEVDDVKYAEWYFNCGGGNEEHKEELIKYLTKYGYEVKRFTLHEGGATYYNLMTPEDAKLYHEEEERISEFDKTCKTGAPIEFVPTRNIDEYGEYREDGITYAFPEYKDMYYNGYTYFVPIKNGKICRIKNKTVVVTKYEWDAEKRILTINEFTTK